MNFHVTFSDANGESHGVFVRGAVSQEEAATKARETMNEVCQMKLWDPSEFELEAIEPEGAGDEAIAFDAAFDAAFGGIPQPRVIGLDEDDRSLS